MASADVTLRRAFEFEADGTQKTATLKKPGGFVRCLHATVPAFINIEGGAVVTTAPAGDACIELPAIDRCWTQLPGDCASFTFKAAASSTIQYINP